jgi:hypothetical protein
MNFKEEIKFQLDQGRAMFSDLGQFMSEALVLGAVGIVMVVVILAGLGGLTEILGWLF